ncbi:MAG: hypothetical protein ACNA71_05905 [Kiritimatiellia bacterium]
MLFRSGHNHGLREGLISRGVISRRRTDLDAISSDRVMGPLAGRRAKHDGVALCLLRRDNVHAIPMRREQRIARNRRLLIRLWVVLLLWWGVGWFLF